MKYSRSSRQTAYKQGQPLSSADGAVSSSRGDICRGSARNIVSCCFVAALAAFAVASFQSGFFSEVRPFGIAPDLCLGLTVACGMFFGAGFGALTGVASGFFIDALTVGGTSFNVIFYFLCGAIVGVFAVPEPRPIKDIWRYLARISIACTAKKISECLWIVLTSPSLDASRLLFDFILRGIVCTVVFSLIVYIPTSAAFLIHRKVTEAKKRF